MEPVGLAVGLIGLAGLFTTCVEMVDRAHTYLSAEFDAHVLDIKFKAIRLELREWGLRVGFDSPDGLVSHPALEDPLRVATVRQLLQVIKTICSTDDTTPRRRISSFPIRTDSSLESMPFKSRRQKLNWALWGKGERQEQVDMLRDLVRELYNLVPIYRPIESGAHPIHSSNNNNLLAKHSSTLERIEAQIRQKLAAGMRREIQSWVLGSSISNDRFDDSVRKKLDGTCNWILDRSLFTTWSSSDFKPTSEAKCLWITGPAGFGKTTLCANIIEHMSSLAFKSPVVAHFFFSSRSDINDDPFLAVRSWVAQIISHNEDAFKLACQKFEATSDQIATRALVLTLLQDTINILPGCTLVADGLDECTSIVNFLKVITDTIVGLKTRILMVSRDLAEIRQALVGGEHPQFFEYRISPEDVRSDTAMCARNIVDKKLPNKSEDVRSTISETMADRCEGQFLWLELQEESLRKGMNQKQLERAINKAPAGLNRIYDQNWKRIMELEEMERTRAFTILRLTAFAFRPLTVFETAEAVVVDTEEEELLVDEWPDDIDDDYVETEIVGLCGSLVEIKSQDVEPENSIGWSTIHLKHFSVKQYLLSSLPLPDYISENERLRLSHEKLHSSMLAKICLAYVNIPCNRRPEKSSSGWETTFFEYAATYWPSHVGHSTEEIAALVELALRFLDSSNPNYLEWVKFIHRNYDTSDMPHFIASKPLYHALGNELPSVAVKMVQMRGFEAVKTDKGFSVLRMACRKGLSFQFFQMLLDAGADPCDADPDGSTAIMAAAYTANVPVVQLLLEKGADVMAGNKSCNATHSATKSLEVTKLFIEKGVDFTDNRNDRGTPLHYAANEGNTAIIKVLLDCSVPIEAKTDNLVTPLHVAVGQGNLAASKLLLDRGANIEARDNQEATPMHFAVIKNHIKIMKLLLERKADLTARDKDAWTLLHTAARHGHSEIIEFLIENGADVAALDKKGSTPLHVAALHGKCEATKMLLEKGADIAVRDDVGQTPCFDAAIGGEYEAFQILFEKNPDTTATDDDGDTLLHVAARGGNKQIVSFLLRNGASTEAENSSGITPLYAASLFGSTEITEILIENDADVNRTYDPDHGCTVLHVVAEDGDLDAINFWIDRGIDVTAKTLVGQSGETAMHRAALFGHFDAVKLILDRVSRDSQVPYNVDDSTLLVRAATSGNVDMVTFLLDHGWKVNGLDAGGLAGLLTASDHGHVEMIHLLLSRGADVMAGSIGGFTPLHAACRSGSPGAVRLLINAGADVSALDDKGISPLCMAVCFGQAEAVKLLLDAGADLEYKTKDGSGSTDTGKLSMERRGHAENYQIDSFSALHYASFCGHLDIVKVLLETDPSMLDIVKKDEHTPLHYAVLKDHFELADFLLAQGLEIQAAPLEGRTPLHVAAETGSDSIVKFLCDRGARVDAKDNNGKTALHIASACSNPETLNLLLNHGACIEANDNDGATPLHMASVSGRTESLRFLLDRGASIEARRKDGRTALHQAAVNGHAQVAQELLDRGAHMAVADLGWTPLHDAAYWGKEEVIEVLLLRGADIEATLENQNAERPLHLAAARDHLAAVRMLLDHAAIMAATDARGITILHYSAFNGCCEILKLLIDRGFSPSIASNNRCSPLVSAASGGQMETFRILVDMDFDLGFRYDNGWTVLHHAANSGNADIVKILLDRAVDVDAQDQYGNTSVMRASIQGHPDCIQVLLDQGGASLQARSKAGQTALHLAAMHDRTEVVKMLLGRGACIEARDNDGATPLYCAVSKAKEEVTKLLLLEKADPNVFSVFSKEGLPIIHWAAAYGMIDVLVMLANGGYELNVKNYFGMDALTQAVQYGHLGIIIFLLERARFQINEADNRGRTYLFYASRFGRTSIVKHLMSECTADPYIIDQYGATALFGAVRNGHVEIAQLLLTSYPSLLQGRDCFGRTPSWWARRLDDAEMTACLQQYRGDDDDEPWGQEDEAVAINTTSFAPQALFCYCCTISMSSSEVVVCEACDYDHHCLCKECQDAGMTCRGIAIRKLTERLKK